MTRLRALYPWPAVRPPLAADLTGWFGSAHRRLLGARLGEHTRFVVELGSWKGLSTRFLAKAAPRAIIAAVDHWEGSAEHHADPEKYPELPFLYDQFLYNLWDLRGRVVPVRESTERGMAVIAALGLKPDLIYVDAAHDEQSAYRDIQRASTLFPDAMIVGDDYNPGYWPGVIAAVDRCAAEQGLTVVLDGIVWALEPAGR